MTKRRTDPNVNAVILCAGRCSRFNGVPKGLQVIDGEVIIDRLIGQLREAGITDIMLVLGHNGRTYRDHFEDEFVRGTLKYTYNRVYDRTESFGSLKVVGSYVRNTLILCQDAYYIDNIFIGMPTDHSWYSCYKCLATDRTSGWTADLLPTGYLMWSSDKLDGEYALISTCYVTQDAAMRIRIMATRSIGDIEDLKVEDVINGCCAPRVLSPYMEWNLNSLDDNKRCEAWVKKYGHLCEGS